MQSKTQSRAGKISPVENGWEAKVVTELSVAMRVMPEPKHKAFPKMVLLRLV